MTIVMTAHELLNIERCPHCNIAHPRMTKTSGHLSNRRQWNLYQCASCSNVAMAVSVDVGHDLQDVHLSELYPSAPQVAGDLPEKAGNYLNQAVNSIQSPDGCVMLAGSAVDAMLQAKGLSDGTVYSRIDTAVKKNILTPEMGEWAHEVRLGSNRPRHSDEDNPHVTIEEAKQAIDFVQMLGHILFVLPQRVAERKSEVS